MTTKLEFLAGIAWHSIRRALRRALLVSAGDLWNSSSQAKPGQPLIMPRKVCGEGVIGLLFVLCCSSNGISRWKALFLLFCGNGLLSGLFLWTLKSLCSLKPHDNSFDDVLCSQLRFHTEELVGEPEIEFNINGPREAIQRQSNNLCVIT